MYSLYGMRKSMPEESIMRAKKMKKKVAFICVHNSCRSQIAEALGKHLASDVFESFSAGTETKPQINQDAVRIMKEMYGIDMKEYQHSKLVEDIPAPDLAISMGCNVSFPFIGRNKSNLRNIIAPIVGIILRQSSDLVEIHNYIAGLFERLTY